MPTYCWLGRLHGADGLTGQIEDTGESDFGSDMKKKNQAV